MDSMIKSLLLVLIALTAIPIGMLISKYTKEEIRKGKLELKILMIASALAFLASALIKFTEQSLAMTVSAFIFILALVSLRKA
jgi:hypothetical protein